MRRPFHALGLLILLGSRLIPVSAQAQAAPPQNLGAFLDEEATAVIRLDLTKLNVPKTATRLFGVLVTQESTARTLMVIQNWNDSLQKAGAEEAYLILGLANFPSPPSIVVPLPQGADSKRIGEILCGGGAGKPGFVWPTCAVIHNAVFAGTPESLERIRRNDPKAPLRQGFSDALASLNSGEVQIALAPTADQRRILEEMIPTLPKELGGGPISVITKGMKWGTVSIELEPKSALHLTVQASDASAAKNLDSFVNEALKYGQQAAGTNPGISKALGQIKIAVNGDRLTSNLDVDQFAAIVRPPLSVMRESATRAQCMNNLKQIMLAMHNFLDADPSKAFPPAFKADKAGKPLLSWRVLILPYLDENSLYKEFHLDEAWDSPHNKTLIDRMPAVFHCPSTDEKLKKEGKTTYLVPRGEKTMFRGSVGVKIQEITDGTSNTVAVIDAGSDRAVPWTAPEDWQVEMPLKPDSLLKNHNTGSNAGFADGSVRFFHSSVRPNVFAKFLTTNGGEVIGTDD